MRLFAIADPHLGTAVDKPMDVFGPAWEGHDERLAGNWRRVVRDDDVVLVVGDISWAMTLADAQADLDRLGTLPGRIVLVRGNHDYWWSGIATVRAAIPANVHALQNDCFVADDVVIAGTRGWTIPNGKADERDRKIHLRELARLEMSLEAARRATRPGMRLVAGLHFPPMLADGAPTGFTELLERYGVAVCAYGHLHADAIADAVEGVVRGISYRLVSCNAVDFTPVAL